jgi:pimeloyl-ACP methyl ester carboxylesterase
MTTFLLIIGVGAVIWAAVVGLVRAVYGALDPAFETLRVPTADGWTLSVHRLRASPRRFEQPVVLCHGLANNHRLFSFHGAQNLAGYLAQAGFDCYLVDLRGAGGSGPPDEFPTDASFDDYVRFDAPAVAARVLADSGAQRLFWVGHSMGGLIGLAGATTSLQGLLQGLVTIGSPAFLTLPRPTQLALGLGRRLALNGQLSVGWLTELVAPLSGLVKSNRVLASANLAQFSRAAQRRLMATVFAPMWAGVLAQFHDWARLGVFRSRDGTVDYRGPLKHLELPLLVVGGSVDGLAPLEPTRTLFAWLESSDKTLALFGRAFGQPLEYGHGDLVVGERAPAEVYPVLRAWLEARATPGAP